MTVKERFFSWDKIESSGDFFQLLPSDMRPTILREDRGGEYWDWPIVRVAAMGIYVSGDHSVEYWD